MGGVGAGCLGVFLEAQKKNIGSNGEGEGVAGNQKTEVQA